MVRRIVTGEAGGKALIASDEELEFFHLGGGFKFANLWGSDEIPAFPQDGSPPPTAGLMPGPGGYRFTMMRIEPQQSISMDSAPPLIAAHDSFADTSIEGVVPGEAPGMHRTDTTDLGVVVAGAISMELDNGEIVEMTAGTVFVLNGVNHKWSNAGDIPCDVVVALVGGRPRAG